MLLRLILVLTQVTIAGSFATFPCRQSLVLELNRSRVHIKAAAFRQSERRRNSRLFNNEPLDYEDEKQEILKIKDQEFMERSKRWVVIVDDENSIRDAVGDYLYDQGYKVTGCVDADALLKVVTTPPKGGELPIVPDAIVCDIRMPGMNGIELVRALRGSQRLQRVPIVMLTAKSLTVDRIEGYEAGADVYLTKPFNPEELLTVVDNLIVRRNQMMGKEGKLADLQAEIANVKQILRINSENKVKATTVYLSTVEREVLELLCKGLTNADIATERSVSLGRTKDVVQSLYLKTQTRTRTELVRWALQTGYVSPKQL